MFFLRVLRHALFVLFPISSFLTAYLYLYPVFDPSCAFPAPGQDAKTAHHNTWRQHVPFASPSTGHIAPFRLLSLGDPQLEGDSSIPDPQATSFPNFSKFWKDALLLDGTQHTTLQRIRHSLHDLIDFFLDDIPKAFHVYRKRLDHVGNDYYLGHIYKTVHWWSLPTHITVLGDLVGSQWIDDDEFEWRGWRFWNRVFRDGNKVPDEIATDPSAGTIFDIGDNAEEWKRRIINVAGNHDIGYAGDLSSSRVDRFVRVFGKLNYEVRFKLSKSATGSDIELEAERYTRKPIPELRLIVLNDMNLDAPAGSPELQAETYQFMNDIISASRDVERPAHFTIVLTHIPLHKDAGVCVDSPFFDYFSGDFSDGVKEQNHLSKTASEGFLQGIFGMSGDPNAQGHGFGRNGVILNGHDHEGCDTYHYINQTIEGATEPPQWQAMTWKDALTRKLHDESGLPGLREITVRSMMGDFAGNAGFLSVWFNENDWEWEFEFANCRLGRQHFWWIVHILDLITICVATAYIISSLVLLACTHAAREISAFISRKGKFSKMRAPASVTKAGLQESVTSSKSNGHLEVPEVSNKSLRKRRSRQKLRSVSPAGSAISSTSQNFK